MTTAGVLGAYLAMFPRARVWSLVPFFFFIPLRLPAWLVLGLRFVLQWAYASGTAVSQCAGVCRHPFPDFQYRTVSLPQPAHGR